MNRNHEEQTAYSECIFNVLISSNMLDQIIIRHLHFDNIL